MVILNPSTTVEHFLLKPATNQPLTIIMTSSLYRVLHLYCSACYSGDGISIFKPKEPPVVERRFTVKAKLEKILKISPRPTEANEIQTF